MKKIFTLALSFVIGASAFAQYGNGRQNDNNYQKDRDVVFNDGRNDHGNNRFGTYNFSKREMDMEISKINRKYDDQLRAVRSRFFMNRQKKEMAMYAIENQRKAEIRAVESKFYDRRNTFNDRDQKKRW